MRRLTYKKAGVDIDKANLFKQRFRALLRKSRGPLASKDIGGFGSPFVFHKERYKEPVLVSSSDGVGTKLKIAILAKRHDTIGIDAVAMNVNDILCLGAKPLFFLDYIAYSILDEDVLIDIVKGISNGCREAGCSLIGGETAQMPGWYKKGEYDVAGFCVGVAEKNEMIDGSKMKTGDIVVGLESNGLHSNGFSLVRKIFSQSKLKSLSKELLRPTRIYVKPVLALKERVKIKGIAHITGGAFLEKVPKIIPKDKSIVIVKASWPVPKIFRLIQNEGRVAEKEMYRTFNMGIGMLVVISPKDFKTAKNLLAKFKINSWIVGSVIKGGGEVRII
ncbi:MAG: phosphoribosylaminoimidazole synthetase [Omnitrophica WOR_2 bacterium SM23_29]|nr:MAG: phosphoribosylaminoimidazole synthetase [Omnitrophica WOR_2 bacterium SM23_29]